MQSWKCKKQELGLLDSAWLDMTPADADMFGVPDPDSLIQLPWNKEVGWLASDVWMNGKLLMHPQELCLKNK